MCGKDNPISALPPGMHAAMQRCRGNVNGQRTLSERDENSLSIYCRRSLPTIGACSVTPLERKRPCAVVGELNGLDGQLRDRAAPTAVCLIADGRVHSFVCELWQMMAKLG